MRYRVEVWLGITTDEAHLAFRTDELPRGLNLATGLLADLEAIDGGA